MKIKIRNFKIIDPALQSILFLAFTYSLNSNWYYREVFAALLVWQLASALLHLSFKKITKLKKERKMHLIIFSVYLVAYVLVSLLLRERYVDELLADGVKKVPVNDLVFLSAGLCICFWYCVICFREIKRIIEKNFHN